MIEVLIAMVIIVVIFTIAMQVFSNVMQTSVSSTKIKVENQMRMIAEQVKREGKLDEETILLDSVRYELKVVATAERLSKLEVSAMQGDQKVASYRCLFISKNNEEN